MTEKLKGNNSNIHAESLEEHRTNWNKTLLQNPYYFDIH